MTSDMLRFLRMGFLWAEELVLENCGLGSGECWVTGWVEAGCKGP
jgi:hypothetical protein